MLSAQLSVITGSANRTTTYYPNGSWNTVEPRPTSCDCGAPTREAWTVFSYLCVCCGEEKFYGGAHDAIAILQGLLDAALREHPE